MRLLGEGHSDVWSSTAVYVGIVGLATSAPTQLYLLNMMMGNGSAVLVMPAYLSLIICAGHARCRHPCRGARDRDAFDGPAQARPKGFGREGWRFRRGRALDGLGGRFTGILSSPLASGCCEARVQRRQ